LVQAIAILATPRTLEAGHEFRIGRRIGTIGARLPDMKLELVEIAGLALALASLIILAYFAYQLMG
jgi:hypothetical protein